jgi:hypothetical protein
MSITSLKADRSCGGSLRQWHSFALCRIGGRDTISRKRLSFRVFT